MLIVMICTNVNCDDLCSFPYVVNAASPVVLHIIAKGDNCVVYSIQIVVLGLQQEEYTVCECGGYVTVCLELFSGQLASTVLKISANISTQNYSAQCM